MDKIKSFSVCDMENGGFWCDFGWGDGKRARPEGFSIRAQLTGSQRLGRVRPAVGLGSVSGSHSQQGGALPHGFGTGRARVRSRRLEASRPGRRLLERAWGVARPGAGPGLPARDGPAALLRELCRARELISRSGEPFPSDKGVEGEPRAGVRE